MDNQPLVSSLRDYKPKNPNASPINTSATQVSEYFGVLYAQMWHEAGRREQTQTEGMSHSLLRLDFHFQG